MLFLILSRFFNVNGAMRGILKNWKKYVHIERGGRTMHSIYLSLKLLPLFFLQWIRLLCLCLKGFLVACKKVEHDGTKACMIPCFFEHNQMHRNAKKPIKLVGALTLS
jgi:hypothetical protein